MWQETTAAEYDSLLAKAKVDFPKRLLRGSETVSSLGPAAVQLRHFNPGFSPTLDFWTRIQVLPNIQLDRGFSVEMLISHVWNENGEDLFSGDEPMRQATEQFKKDKDLTLLNTVRLSAGATKESILEVEGDIIFSMPLSLEVFEFGASEMQGVVRSSGGVEIELLSLNLRAEDSWLELMYTGPDAGFLTAIAFDEEGKQLVKTGFSKNEVSGGWHYAYSFSGVAQRIKTILSKSRYKRSYPFSLKP